MSRSRLILAGALLAALALPASAASIKHTNRAGGDPEAQSAPTGHTPPPADTTVAHALDKAHEAGALR